MSEERKARDLFLLDTLDQFERASFDGSVWRAVREGRDVLQASAIGARWDPGSFDVLYTSLQREGALAELYFHLSRQPVFPSKIKFHLYRIKVHANKVLYLTRSLLEKLGIPSTIYPDLNYDRSQEIADVAYFLGFEGVVAPSARWNCSNLVLFWDRIGPADIESEYHELVDWSAWKESREGPT